MNTTKGQSKYHFDSIEEVKGFMKMNNIHTRSEFLKKSMAAYNKAKVVPGFDEFLPSKQCQKTPEMTKEEFITYIKSNNIGSSTELYNASAAIHKMALRNGWMDECFPKRKKFHHKDYFDWSIDDVRELIRKEHIKDHREFYKKYVVLNGICYRNGWDTILFPEKTPEYHKFTFEQFMDFVKSRNITTRGELFNEAFALYTKSKKEKINEVYWIDIAFPSNRRTEAYNITSFVKEFLQDWDEALHYPNLILMKLAESFGDTTLLNKLVKKIASTDPGSIERKELLEEMGEKIVENDNVTCAEIERMVKMGKEMEENVTDDPIEAMERLMNGDNTYDSDNTVTAETLGKQLSITQKALNNKMLDNKNCGDIVLTIKNVFLHRMICLWVDGDDYVTEKMMENLF